jgi:hypothetical protein
VPQFERERLLEDHLVHALPELGAQQRLAGGQAPLRTGECRDQQALQRHVAQHRIQVDRARRAVDRDCGDHGIDDQRADIGDGGRQDACDQSEECQRNRQRAARGPDQAERVAGVLEDLGQGAQGRDARPARRRRGGGTRCVGIEASAGDHHASLPQVPADDPS